MSKNDILDARVRKAIASAPGGAITDTSLIMKVVGKPIVMDAEALAVRAAAARLVHAGTASREHDAGGNVVYRIPSR